MDSSIRVLLQSCLDENDPNSVTEPYQKLKTESEGNAKSNVGTDLYVICAEAACQYQKFNVAEDCIKMYFKNLPPENQYLCRAYMCQAQLHAPTSTKNPAQIDKAVHYLLKAINFAKQNSRYHFLVYNASVLYWQFCRPFLKPNYKRFLAKTLHQVVKALDDIDDEDYEWRAQLMIALIECHIDAGRKDDANQIASAASQFTKTNVPNLYKNILGLQIQYRLVEYGKLAKETKSSPDLHLFFKIHRLKAQLETEEKSDVGHDLTKFFKNLTGMCETDVSETSTEISERSNTANMPRTATPVAMETIDRLTLILELAKLCMAQGFCKLANDCLDYVKKYTQDPATTLAVEFIQCELMVKLLGDKQENYSQSVVQLRLEAIEKLEQYLTTALRYDDPEVIQLGCMTMWNLCLPLFQSNLRRHVRKPLSIVADALESIDSLLALLRCQIHTELAKCEEDEEQLELALIHLRKALLLDDDGVYSERLGTSLTRLQLRSTLYTTPERPEDVAAMIIEQARTSKDSGTSKMKRASLIKAGIALAPDAFALVLESESETKEPSKHKEPPTLFSKLARRAEHFEKAVSKAAGHLKRLGTQNDQERSIL